MFQGWSEEDRENLAALLGLEKGSSSAAALEEAIWAAYNNRARSIAKAGAKNAATFIGSKIMRKEHEAASVRDTWKEPSYEELLATACRHVKAFDKNASVQELEAFLVEKLFVQAIHSMGPHERHRFLESSIDIGKLAEDAGVKNASLKGQYATLGALSAAQASGFGVYLLATTTLGALTSLLGITLPFAVYTGLTSLLAVAIGPVGWSVLGFSAFWKLTGPNWKRLFPALVYIVSVRHKPQGERP